MSSLKFLMFSLESYSMIISTLKSVFVEQKLTTERIDHLVTKQ